MLCVARQARTAYRNGPAQNRRCVAGQEIRNTYTTAIVAWMDMQGDMHPYNVAGERALCAAYTRIANWRNTGLSSTYPLMTTNSNVKCYQYDGVNDVMPTSNSFSCSSAYITVFTLYRNSSAATAVIGEYSTDYTAQTTGWFVGGTNASATAALRGNVGTSLRTWSSSQTPWTVNASILNKAAGLGSEVIVYENGSQITSFTTSTNSDNTNDFTTANRLFNGCRSTGALPMSGVIASTVIINLVLTAAQIQQATQLLRWRAGLT